MTRLVLGTSSRLFSLLLVWLFQTPPALVCLVTGASSLKPSGPVATLVCYDNLADYTFLGTGEWPAVCCLLSLCNGPTLPHLCPLQFAILELLEGFRNTSLFSF